MTSNDMRNVVAFLQAVRRGDIAAAPARVDWLTAQGHDGQKLLAQAVPALLDTLVTGLRKLTAIGVDAGGRIRERQRPSLGWRNGRSSRRLRSCQWSLGYR